MNKYLGSESPFRDNAFKGSSETGGIIARCVHVAMNPNLVGVRDSKDSTKKTLHFTREEWIAFTNGVKKGEFDIK